jgi:hypothetical protein
MYYGGQTAPKKRDTLEVAVVFCRIKNRLEIFLNTGLKD